MMIIETERLIIRSIKSEDEKSFIEMASDSSLQDIFGDCADCSDWMGSWIQEVQELDRKDDPHREYLAYAVTEKQDGTLLGSVGCSYYEDLKQVGVTFFTGSAYRGNGYASEAVTAYIRHFFTHYNIHQLIATVREDNTASWRTLEKAGFVLTETKQYRDINDETEKPYRFYTLHGHGLDRVLSYWGLRDSNIRKINNTAWQVGNDYVLKVYRDRETLERNLNMLRLLYEQNIPVARIIPACGSTPYVSLGDAFYFLSEKLPGCHVTQIDNPIAHTMGEVIARLHAAFQKCEPLESVWNNSLLDEMNGWVRERMEKSSWKRVSKEEYLQTVSQLAAIYGQLPTQLIHRDIHFGNFLFADGIFSGYIDFDLSQRNIRIFDLCYFLLGLLSEEENFTITEENWFLILENVFDGYESIQKLTVTEKKAVPYVMECIELLFAAYFEDPNEDCPNQKDMEIYRFVRRYRNKIWKTLRLS